ncbi:MAG TPA: VOC family protein [Terracidiphilus sp.]|nr:VOC family protein [Terracidiphilus sp.]
MVSRLGQSKLVAFAATTDPAKARSFYEGVLGLRLASDEAPFALVFDANGTMLRVTTVKEHHPDPFTVLGWQVNSIDSTVGELAAAGVEFQRYPGVNDKDPNAIWKSPGGARIAWFKDPDGNVLSVTEFAAG